MAFYRYYLFDKTGVLKAADSNAQVTDFAAMDCGRELLADGRGFAAVEIWREENFVAGWQRNGEPRMPKPAAAKMARHPALAGAYAEAS
jgi:hypothetical protein